MNHSAEIEASPIFQFRVATQRVVKFVSGTLTFSDLPLLQVLPQNITNLPGLTGINLTNTAIKDLSALRNAPALQG